MVSAHFLFVFGDTWVWTQSLMLARQSAIWTTSPTLFCVGFFQDRVSWPICPCWLQTTILLISASCVGKITDVNHRHRVSAVLIVAIIYLSFLTAICTLMIIFTVVVLLDSVYEYPISSWFLLTSISKKQPFEVTNGSNVLVECTSD
jgi:hypothetical protein